MSEENPKYEISKILCDIEGTTTSIDFVKNILFPFSFENVQNYLENNWDDPTVQKIIKDIILLRVSEDKYNEAPKIDIYPVPSSASKIEKTSQLLESISNVVRYFITKDLKLGPLKSLQGLMWEEGFKNNKFKGHVYDDVVKAFQKWTKSGIDIYIYSSGSVKAQKLLFEYSQHGNLLTYIKGHFDTAIGHKQEQQSYGNILKELNQSKADKVLFLTDIPNEAYAAKRAGMQCILLDRPGNGELSKEDRENFRVIKSFDSIECLLS